MIYGSVCSGIEAASVAWEPLGWKPKFFSEIEKFPSAVLAHHFPEVPNLGDFTKIGPENGPIDLLVGGTPCQSFSVAGLRKGLDDERGNLALEYVRLAARLHPRWIVWENVPGVLSANDGRAFGSFLGALQERGYGLAYRVLDAQFFGVPQRRRRVFVVAYLGDWRPAAAVLFERDSLRRNTPKGRCSPERVAALTANGVGACGADDNQAQSGHLIGSYSPPVAASPLRSPEGCQRPAGMESELDFLCVTGHRTHALRGEGFDASEDGTGRGNPIVTATDPVAQTIGARDFKGAGSYRNGSIQSCQMVEGRVRRLTPRECERLQGFPDDWTLIPHGKNRAKGFLEWLAYIRLRRHGLSESEARRLAQDGPRYKAVGNSMAVPVMRWIGTRLSFVDQLLRKP